jgi:hypothetical protein
MRTPPKKRLAAVPSHELGAPFVGDVDTAPAGSPTSHSALPAPLPFSCNRGDCAPSALEKVPGDAVSAIGRLSSCVQQV